MAVVKFICMECFEDIYIEEKDPVWVCPICQNEDVFPDETDDLPYLPDASFYDDNFGWWDDMDDPDQQEWYHSVQKKSVEKDCLGCGRRVKILPDYDYCDSCATRREQGWDY
jgi:hypothetical protein